MHMTLVSIIRVALVGLYVSPALALSEPPIPRWRAPEKKFYHCRSEGHIDWIQIYWYDAAYMAGYALEVLSNPNPSHGAKHILGKYFGSMDSGALRPYLQLIFGRVNRSYADLQNDILWSCGNWKRNDPSVSDRSSHFTEDSTACDGTSVASCKVHVETKILPRLTQNSLPIEQEYLHPTNNIAICDWFWRSTDSPQTFSEPPAAWNPNPRPRLNFCGMLQHKHFPAVTILHELTHTYSVGTTWDAVPQEPTTWDMRWFKWSRAYHATPIDITYDEDKLVRLRSINKAQNAENYALFAFEVTFRRFCGIYPLSLIPRPDHRVQRRHLRSRKNRLQDLLSKRTNSTPTDPDKKKKKSKSKSIQPNQPNYAGTGSPEAKRPSMDPYATRSAKANEAVGGENRIFISEKTITPATIASWKKQLKLLLDKNKMVLCKNGVVVDNKCATLPEETGAGGGSGKSGSQTVKGSQNPPKQNPPTIKDKEAGPQQKKEAGSQKTKEAGSQQKNEARPQRKKEPAKASIDEPPTQAKKAMTQNSRSRTKMQLPVLE